MSFFCNFKSDKCPGPINGNPLNGLCEKVCIEVKKVFDACMSQTQQTGLVLELSDYTPQNPAFPLTFVSAKSTSSKGTVTNLIVDPIPDSKNSARVRADIVIPLSVAYIDANGVSGVATSKVTISEDIILNVPQPSIMPYEVEAVVSLISTEGTYTGEGQFTINCCVTIITKIVMEVELLVPSYGYVAMPPCQEYTQEVCAGFFELPIYPQQ